MGKETVLNRKAAGMLVQKWVKQVLYKGSTADDVFAEEEAPQPQLEPQPPETEESLREIEKKSAERNHPAIPTVGTKKYVIKPLPRHQAIPRSGKDLTTNRGKLGAVLQELAKPNQKAWKPYMVSIAGRQVNAI